MAIGDNIRNSMEVLRIKSMFLSNTEVRDSACHSGIGNTTGLPMMVIATSGVGLANRHWTEIAALAHQTELAGQDIAECIQYLWRHAHAILCGSY